MTVNENLLNRSVSGVPPSCHCCQPYSSLHALILLIGMLFHFSNNVFLNRVKCVGDILVHLYNSELFDPQMLRDKSGLLGPIE